MKHLKEKLELCEWLYSKGLLCDMGYQKEEEYFEYLENTLERISEPVWRFTFNPWFTLERCLDILFQEANDDIYFINQIWSMDYDFQLSSHQGLSQGVEDCSHLAALKLLKRVIERKNND